MTRGFLLCKLYRGKKTETRQWKQCILIFCFFWAIWRGEEDEEKGGGKEKLEK
jgi:hypothetical protein